MVHISSKRSTIYSHFELDVWGYYSNTCPSSNIPSFGASLTNLFHFVWNENMGLLSGSNTIYIYSIDIVNLKTKSSSLKWRFVYIRMLKFFYMSLSHRQFRSYGCSALNKEGFLVGNYLFFLEGSVASVLYRMNFVSNVFILRQFITYGHVIVGVRIETFLNCNVGLCEAVRVEDNVSERIWVELVRRLGQKSVYFNSPRYMFVDYSLMFGFLYCKPSEYDVAFPIGIDVYSGMDHT